MKIGTNKTDFILGFAALVIGMGIFGDYLNSIKINLGFNNYSLRDIGLLIFVILLLSIYLYALDRIRYGIEALINWKIFKMMKGIAHLLYTLAVLLPLLVFFVWFFVFLIGQFPINNITKHLNFIGSVSSIFIGVISVIALLYQLKNDVNKFKTLLSNKAARSMLLIEKFTRKEEWRMVVIESFRVIELMLKNKAKEIGLDSGNLPFNELVKIFVTRELITKEQAIRIDRARGFRNILLHSNEVVTKEQAMKAAKIINEIGDKMTYITFASSYFEEKVVNILCSIFPKHHIFRQYKIGENKTFDFMAEGPGYKYLIEIKNVDSLNVLNEAIKQLETELKKDNSRGLIIAPSSENVINISNTRIKIAYYDAQNENFSNQKDIIDWIYN